MPYSNRCVPLVGSGTMNGVDALKTKLRTFGTSLVSILYVTAFPALSTVMLKDKRIEILSAL